MLFPFRHVSCGVEVDALATQERHDEASGEERGELLLLGAHLCIAGGTAAGVFVEIAVAVAVYRRLLLEARRRGGEFRA